MKKYKASMYLRVSREDKTKDESESISNQKSIIQTYIQQKHDLELVSIKIDDGYSGSNFNRPAFKELMEELKQGKINCIIVKDFSRFGRNFIEVGKYIEEIFPFMGVRFISINDGYDSLNTDNQDIIVPFKNLINDAYLADISLKIRTQLNIKRKNGEFIGAFSPYGYLKDKSNKNKLIVDEYASKIVKQIFELKLQGYSHTKIAKKLNDAGILCPMEYKKSIGMNFTNGFKSKCIGKWNHNTVIRILKNPVYIGILEQGKQTTINYKISKKIINSKDKWIVCENTHTPIIDKYTFENVQKLMLSDTRVAKGMDKVSLFSGIVYCGDCKRSLIKKNNGTKEKPYIYYVCSGELKKNGCTYRSIRDNVLENIVLETIKLHIKILLDMEILLKSVKETPYVKNEMEHNKMDNNEKLEKLEKRKIKIYEDYNNRLINLEEYTKFTQKIKSEIEFFKKNIENNEDNFLSFINVNYQNIDFIQYFKEYKDIKKLDRKLVVSLIDKIYLYEDFKIKIKFKFNHQYEKIKDF